ncbi:MAG: N-acetyltransferase family protein [Limisphaerales bacterium]
MIRVRPAQREDCPGILEIYNDAVRTTTATYDYEPRTLTHRQAWFDDHKKIGFPIFVALESTGRIVGWSALNRYHDRMGYRFTTENSIYIAADHRGQGIGKMLLAPLIESARKIGVHVIIAAIDGANEASIRLHARYGFEKVGHFKRVGYKFDRWLDVVYMELLLPEPNVKAADRL